MRMSGPVVLDLTTDDGHVPSRSCAVGATWQIQLNEPTTLAGSYVRQS